MRSIDLDQLDRDASTLEAAVDRTPAIDPWCSAPDWVLPVHRAFAPEASPLVLTDGGDGFALLARYRTEDGIRLLGGLEPLWGFASPLIGADPVAIARGLSNHLVDDPDWDALAISGVPRDQEHIVALAEGFSPLGQVGLREGITRRLIHLDDGLGPWLGRRSSKFRRNLRRAQRRADAAGIRFEVVDDQPGLFDRILAIEQRSWKGAQGDGITAPEMQAFYRMLTERLQPKGRLRCVIASHGAIDHGYILGGVRNHRYRGLQLSYTQEAGTLSLGHLLQTHEIHRMGSSGITVYDMGMDMEYKQRMSDQAMETVMLVVVRQPTN